jgi:ketosteroid isomerase-like protein
LAKRSLAMYLHVAQVFRPEAFAFATGDAFSWAKLASSAAPLDVELRARRIRIGRSAMRLSKNRFISVFITIVATAIACSGVPRSIHAQTSAPKGPLTEAQILDLQKKFQDACVAADMPTLSALMADDAVFVHGSATVQTKAQFINSITSGQLKVTTYEIKEPRVVFFDGGALVTGLIDVGLAPPPSAAAGTPPRLLHMRGSTVWLRKLDGWQLILNQGTPLMGPPPASH